MSEFESNDEDALQRIARGAFWLALIAVETVTQRRVVGIDEAKLRSFVADVACGDVIVPKHERPVDGDEWKHEPGEAQQLMRDAAQIVIRAGGLRVLRETPVPPIHTTTTSEHDGMLSVHIRATPCADIDAFIACVLASLETPNEVPDESPESQ